jgi:response regulator RpfG family c-di-GMP phosphodiesterase
MRMNAKTFYQSKQSNKKLVYLIDDEEIDCLITRVIFQNNYPDCEVIVFNSADQTLRALELLQENTSDYPSLILLDISMPSKTGWEFLEEYMNLDNYPFDNCPVYILTSSIRMEDKIMASKYACVADFLHKPFSKEYVEQKIKRLFEV